MVSDRVAAREGNPVESYKAAQWTNLGFGILGQSVVFLSELLVLSMIAAVSLSIIWLRGIGPIGHNSKTAPPGDVEHAEVAKEVDKEEVEEVKKPAEGVVDVQVRDATRKKAPEESSL